MQEQYQYSIQVDDNNRSKYSIGTRSKQKIIVTNTVSVLDPSGR